MSIIEAVKVEPLPVAERIAAQRQVMTRTLRRFRERLEGDAGNEPWELLEVPAALVLADVCDALGLDPGQRREVLGAAGTAFLEELREATVRA